MTMIDLTVSPSRTATPSPPMFEHGMFEHDINNSIPISVQERTTTTMGINVPENNSTIIDDNIVGNKRPLHTLDIPCRSPSMHKRGKVFSFLPAPSTVDDVDEPSYLGICQECPASIATNTNNAMMALEQVDDESDAPSPSTQDVVTPTADDYANLMFCDSYEEDEARATLLSSETTEPSHDVPEPVGLATAVTITGATKVAASGNSKQRQRRRRRVSFGAAIPTFHYLHDVPPAHAMTFEERSILWYSRSDLELLKSQAQLCIQEMRERVIRHNNNMKNNEESSSSQASSAACDERDGRSKFRAEMLHMENETNSSIRGLEHRVFRRRHTRKNLIREVLECQSHVTGLARFGHVMDVQEKAMLLAKVSRERSVKARMLAFVDAKDDYSEVYAINGHVDYEHQD